MLKTMKKYDVVPGEEVGPVRLGMTREDARRIMGDEPVCFKKVGTSRYDADAFHESGFQIFYGGDDPRVEYIELSGGCGFEACYRCRDVFTTLANELVEFIAHDAPYDEAHPELGYAFIFPKLELSLWRPVIPESEDDPEGRLFRTIGIGINGYFSNRG